MGIPWAGLVQATDGNLLALWFLSTVALLLDEVPCCEKPYPVSPIVLVLQSFISVPLHSLRLVREALGHVSSSAEPQANPLRAPQGSVVGLFPLALIDELIAVATGENAATVENAHSPAAAAGRTKKPCSLTPVMTRGADKLYSAPLPLPLV